MAIDVIKNQSIGFGIEEDSCNTFDERTYCQMANQNDPIEFVWNAEIIGGELINCTDFDDECCFSAGGGETGCPETDQYWAVSGLAYTWNDPGYCTDNTIGGGTAYQDNVLTELGTYKVVVIIDSYPNDVNNTGTFTVILGDAQSEVTSAVAGTYIFYLTPTDISVYNGIRIMSNNGIYCLKYVSVKKVCTDYSVIIKDFNTNEVLKVYDYTLYGVMTIIDGQFFFQANWADFGFDDGCYSICVVNNCDQLVENSTFDEDSDLDGDVDVSDFLVHWTPSNANITYNEGEACHSGSTSTLSACPLLLSATTYLLKYCLTVNTLDSSTITINIAGEEVDARIASEGGGTFYIIFTTTHLPIDCPNLEIIFGDGFDGCITCVTIVPIDTCSECYDLGSHSCTKLLSWTNDDDGFGIAYSQISLTHYMRVGAIIHSPRYPETIDRFAFSDGTRSILYADGEKIWKLLIDYIPEYMHDAIAVAKKHDHFYIDGVEYICSSENYEPQWRDRQRLKFAQSEIEVQKVTQQTLNQNI